MQENKPILTIRNLTIKYDTKVALQDVNLTIYQNDFLGIIGPNGGGKTTLLKAILGLIKVEDNSSIIIDKDITIGYLPQYSDFDSKFPISVTEVVLTGLLNCHVSPFYQYKESDKHKVLQLLEYVGIEEGQAEKNICELSGGQRQRVLIARALISNPQLLILDEPTTYIDKGTEIKLYDLLNKINQQCAIMLVSHDIGTVLSNVRNIACVNKTLHYHAASDNQEEILRHALDCPFDMIAHGHIPHRVLGEH
ncbi:MAG: ABC transporter ATP-binding protein [Prevotellaceae bacterium]|nr:ABC transporter ATP-binding protein [Candidatus Faecinaster equi]